MEHFKDINWPVNATMSTENSENHELFHLMMMAGDFHPLNEMPVLKWFFVTCLALQSIFGTTGSLLVIGSFFIMDALHHTGNAFIVNLALADLCITVIATPANALVVSTLCATGCLASCWNLCMIAINRYVFICHWHYYQRIFTKRNTILLCMFVWLVVYLIELPNHVGWGDLRFSDLFFVCTFANHVHSYALFYVLFGVFIPLTTSFICYLLIYLKVKDSKLTRNRILYARTDRRDSSETFKSESSKTAIIQDPDEPTTRCLTISQKFLDDLKIIRVLFRVQIIYFVMWMPLILLILFHQDTNIDYVWYILVLLSAHGNSAINCLVYAASIDHFRNGYKRLLGLTRKRPETSQSHNADLKVRRGTMRKKNSRIPRGEINTKKDPLLLTGLDNMRRFQSSQSLQVQY